MAKGSKRSKSDHRGRDFAFKVAPKAIPLFFKMGFVYVSVKRKASKAAKLFEYEMIQNGVDKKTARRLSKEYKKGSQFFRHFDEAHGS